MTSPEFPAPSFPPEFPATASTDIRKTDIISRSQELDEIERFSPKGVAAGERFIETMRALVDGA